MGVGANTADLEALAANRKAQDLYLASKCLACGAKATDCPIVDGYCSDVCEEQHKAKADA
jgi:hypothetical protein